MVFQLSADLAISCDNHNDSHLRVNICFGLSPAFLKRPFGMPGNVGFSG